MQTELEARPSRPPILRRIGAGAILLGAAAIGIWLVIGVIKAVLWFVVVVAVLVAVAWALKQLVW